MSRRRRRSGPRLFTVLKDAATWLGGWALIAHETLVPSAEFNLYRLLAGLTLVGVPGASQLLALRIGGEPSSPPEGESPPRRSSSSSSDSGAER